MSKGVKKKGFTLVELVVVLAIFGLLASITGLGLYSWTRYSINKENNENARTIFLAAQESLTHMQASGTLDTIDLTYVEKTKVEQIKQQNTGMDFTNFDKFSGRLYTAIYMPTNKSGIVYNLLKPYLEGTGVLDGAIAIEFDPYDGVVYSVFYSKKAISFEYETDGNIKESGTVGICKRDPGTLKDRLLGYYHTELTVAKPTEIPVIYFPQIDETDDKLLKNEEELYYRIITKGIEIDKNNLEQYTFELNIYAETHNKNAEIITLTINGKQLYESVKNHGIATFKATYIKNHGHEEEDEVKLKVDIESNEIKVVFDSIDVVTIQKILSTNTMKLEQKNNANYLLGFKETFKDTFSIFSLLRNIQGLGAGNVDSSDGRIDFFNISCGGKILRNGSEYAKLGISEPENILFEDIEEKNDGFEIKINNLRHLFNICYFEEIKNNGSPDLKITYNQTGDIFYKDAYIFSSASVNKKPNQETITFPSLEKLNTYSTYNGANYSIDILKLSSELIETYPNNQKNLGIFEVNNGTIQNVTLKKLELTSKISSTDEKSSRDNMSYGSGGFVGVNSGTIKDCKVLSGEINGNVNVGGIAGINENTIDGCESSLLINSLSLGGYNFGGIAGLNTSNGTINDCEYTATRQMRPITESQKNPFVSESLRYNELFGYNIGGIAGKNDSNAKIINCSTKSVDDGYIVGYGSVGGVVGLYSTETVLDGSNNGNRSINEINVVGVDCIGGIVGNLDSCDDFSRTITNWENQGAIIAIDDDEVDASYGGGITAYIGKKGTVSNCMVNVTSTAKKLEMLTFSNGNNVGGICGDFRGQIISDEIVKHNVLVYGHDNVGGLVGVTYSENDALCIIKNQIVLSGEVHGHDNVGGLIGINNNNYNLYNDSKIINTYQNGASVYGNNCVGGVIGYNTNRFISESVLDHSVKYVGGNSNVGGFVGYNNSVIFNQTLEADIVEAKVSNIGGFIGNNEGSLLFNDRSGVIESHVNIIKGEDNVGGFIGFNSYSLNNSQISLKSEVNNITGSNNVGGFIGINNNSFSNNKQVDIIVAEILGKTNNTGGVLGVNGGMFIPDLGSMSITVSKVSGSNNVGGFVGTNQENGSITNCYISKNNVEGNGENIGGVVGKNDGSITMHGLTSIEVTIHNNSESNCTGGIVGYNNGYITGLLPKKAIVESSGGTVGGIAGRNDKSIEYNEEQQLDVDVSGNGDFVGGLVGYNNSDSSIGVLKLNDCNVTNKSGKYTGGIVGYNSGYIYRSNTDQSNSLNLYSEGDYVGGIAGCNNVSVGDNGKIINYIFSSSNIEGNKNVAGVYGQLIVNNDYTFTSYNVKNSNILGNDIVGGLISEITTDSSVTIEGSTYNCVFENAKIVAEKGIAGGIIPILNPNAKVNRVKILNTSIVSKGGDCGTFTAINNSSIIKSYAENCEVSASTYVGSIVGVNYGSISGSRTVNTLLSSENRTTGELVGLNGSLEIIDPAKMAVVNDCIAVNYQNDISINRNYGLTCENFAKIIGCSSYYGTDENRINQVKNMDNEYQKVNNPEITIENPGTTIDFKFLNNPGNSPIYEFAISGYDYSLENTNAIELLHERIDTRNPTSTPINFDNNFYIYSHQLNEGEDIDRYRVKVKHISDESNLLDSVSEINYYYKMELPSVITSVEKASEKEFVLSWEQIENPIYNYLAGYDVYYQIDEEEPVSTTLAKDVNTYTFNFDDAFLNKNVKFWIVAKVGDYSFYDNSIAIVSSSYLIGEDGSPSMTEGN